METSACGLPSLRLHKFFHYLLTPIAPYALSPLALRVTVKAVMFAGMYFTLHALGCGLQPVPEPTPPPPDLPDPVASTAAVPPLRSTVGADARRSTAVPLVADRTEL